MTFRMRNRVRECKPLPLFEELEQRIVLDASVDSGFAQPGYGWDLEYASNPSTSLAPVIDAGELANYKATLTNLTWGIDPSSYGTNTIVLPGGAGSVGQDGVEIWWGLGGLAQIDGDTTTDSDPVCIVSSPYGGGWSNLQVDEISGLTVTGNGTTDDPSRTISLSGPQGAINAALNSLRGQFPEGYNTGNYWNGAAWVPNNTTLYISAYDTEQPSTTVPNPTNNPVSGTFTAVFVDGENATPTITAPTTVTLNQNSAFTFSGGNLISVEDLDWEWEDMELLYCTVSVENGRLDLRDSSSLNRYSHDTNYQTWQFEAYLPWINQALASLQYTGLQAGLDTLTVTVNDWGNHGGESALNVPPAGDTTVTTAPADQTATPVQTAREATATVSINVLMTEIDDTPRIDMSPTATMTGAGPFSITWPAPTLILDSNDADQLDLALRVHHGNLSFSPALPSGVTTVLDTEGPPGDSQIYLRGPQALLNYSLNNLQYTPYAYSAAAPYDQFTGRDLLTVTVMDNDSAHLGSRDPVERIREQRLEIQVVHA
jgi:hypothetical protein